MMKRIQVLIIVIVLGFYGAANAALVSRLGGLAVYDTDLNITWLADANYGNTSGGGYLNWSQANTWAAGLIVGGFSGWRLPTTLQPDASCGVQSSGVSSGINCTGSEMGHLFYTELGGVAGQLLATTHNANYSLFQNLQSNAYWSSTEYAPAATDYAWDFYFSGGSQGAQNKLSSIYALAVRPGDVAAVPEPSSLFLIGSGLIGLIGLARKRSRS